MIDYIFSSPWTMLWTAFTAGVVLSVIGCALGSWASAKHYREEQEARRKRFGLDK